MYVYTDGSSLNNGTKNSKAGIGVWFDFNDSRNISAKLSGNIQTNNRAELTAILLALKTLKNEKREKDKIVIVSDSQYSIKAVTEWIVNWKKNNWKTSKNKPVKNSDLIKDIDNLKNYFTNLSFQYVKAHTNMKDKHSIGNSNADMLARLGADSQK